MNIFQYCWNKKNQCLVVLFMFISIQMGYGQLCVADAGPDQTENQTTSVFLNAVSPVLGTGTWTQLSGPSLVSFANDNDPGTQVFGMVPGIYIFEWTVSDITCITVSDTVGVTFLGVDLEVETLASNTVPDVGDIVNFTINLSNLGDVDATGVAVENLIPPGYGNITAISNGGTFFIGPQAVVWSGLTVPQGTNTLALTFNATVQTPTGVSNEFEHIAQITFCDQIDLDSTPNNDDGDQSEDDEDALTASPQQADLSLIKTVVGNNLAPGVGEQISFEIILTNDGPDDATNVTVVDQLLSGFNFVSYTATAGTYSSATGFWQVGTLANGASETLTIDVTVNPSGNYTNTSQVIASDGYDLDSTPANGVSSEDDQGDVSLTPVEVIDLSLTKTISKSPPLVSDNVMFVLTISNAGPNTATSVEVTDLLPSGFTYISDNGGGSYNAISGLWNVGTLANGASESLNIMASVNPAGIYTNIAEVTNHDQFDADSTPNNNVPAEDDQDEVVVIPEPLVDLSITKTADNLTPNVGDQIVFTVTVRNDGPSDATNVVVTDLLASGYGLVSAVPSSGSYNAANGVWNVGSLNSSNTETLTITANVLSSGDYSNTAELTGLTEMDIDSAPGNNNGAEDDQVSITPTPIPISDLLLRKSVDKLSPVVGEEVIFNINISNLGPSDVTGVEIMDVLPSGYTYVSNSRTAGTYNATTGIWELNNVLPNGVTETLNIVATVNASGDYFNVTEVFSSNNVDPNSIPNNDNVFENDQDSAGTIPIPAADLELSLTVDNEFPDVSSIITFTLTLSNIGPSDASGIVVDDLLPSGYNYISDDSGGLYDPFSGLWYLGSVASGANTTLNILAEVNPSGNYTNRAEVVAAIQLDTDSTPGNNVASEDDQDVQSTTPRHVTDISITNTADDLSPSAGDEIVFTITVNNAGPNDATGLVIEDQLATGYSYISAVATSGTYDNIAGSWSLPNISSGSSEILTLTALVLPNGDYRNTAELIALETYDPDSTPNNNLSSEDDQASVVPVPDGLADLSLVKIVDNPTPNVGDVVRFTISVTNNGPTDATGVVVSERMPIGYIYQSHTTTAGVYNPDTGLWNVNRTIFNQNTETLEVLARVNAPTGEADEYLNVAEITASNFADPDSNHAQGILVDDFSDGVEDDDEASAFVVPQTTDLALTKEVDNTSVNVGDEVVFTITLTNLGTVPATNIGVEDQLPQGYRLVTSSSSLGVFDETSGFWELDVLEVGETAQLELTVEVLDIEDYLNQAALAFVDQIDTNGDNDTDEAFVSPTCLVVYNEFSPNGDGVNDFFKIDCISRYPQNELQVYNRWGNIVYQKRNYNNDWDGTPNGRAIVQKEDQLPVGTYYYILDLGDGSEPRTDWLYLNR